MLKKSIQRLTKGPTACIGQESHHCQAYGKGWKNADLDSLRLTENFTLGEFTCRGRHCCGGSLHLDLNLIEALQELRSLIGSPIYVTSGYRCSTHNTEVGGSPTSWHMKGMAADVVGLFHTPPQLATIAASIPRFASGGIGTYAGWLHLDIRPDGPARWSDL